MGRFLESDEFYRLQLLVVSFCPNIFWDEHPFTLGLGTLPRIIPSNIPSTIPGMGTGKVALQLFLSTPTPRHVYGVEMALHHEGARSHGSHSELACGELNPWIQSWSVYTTHHVLTSEIIPGIFHILVEGF